MIDRLALPLLHRLDAEDAHRLTGVALVGVEHAREDLQRAHVVAASERVGQIEHTGLAGARHYRLDVLTADLRAAREGDRHGAQLSQLATQPFESLRVGHFR